MKVLLIIIDGLADRPIPALGNKTPLEKAETSNMDRLASLGMSGLLHPVDIGIRPGSDVGHLSIFGYDPEVYYQGRGVFEAAGVGFKLTDKDVAFRGNFATVDKNWLIINRRAGRIEDTQELVKAVDGIKMNGVKFLVKKGSGHRVAVVVRGKNLSHKLSDSDPHKENEKVLAVKPLENKLSCRKTAKVVNAFIKQSHQILVKHPLNLERENKGLLPANMLLLRGASIKARLPSFYSRYGLKSAAIAGGLMYQGLARLLGMKVLRVKGATGKEDTDIHAKIKAATDALKIFDFVYLHIKAADSLAEDGDFLAKKAFIERIDKEIAPLLELSDTLIVITADHTTSSLLKRHTADPVPIVIFGKGIGTDEVTTFNERSVIYGKLGYIQGRHLMPILLDQIGKLPIFGA